MFCIVAHWIGVFAWEPRHAEGEHHDARKAEGFAMLSDDSGQLFLQRIAQVAGYKKYFNAGPSPSSFLSLWNRTSCTILKLRFTMTIARSQLADTCYLRTLHKRRI